MLRTKSLRHLVLIAIVVALAGGLLISLIDPNIHSLHDGIWYAWVTMTHVGYGDVAPASFLGRLVGAADPVRLGAVRAVHGFGLDHPDWPRIRRSGARRDQRPRRSQPRPRRPSPDPASAIGGNSPPARAPGRIGAKPQERPIAPDSWDVRPRMAGFPQLARPKAKCENNRPSGRGGNREPQGPSSQPTGPLKPRFSLPTTSHQP